MLKQAPGELLGGQDAKDPVMPCIGKLGSI